MSEERLTIDEIVEHCKRMTKKFEKYNKMDLLENNDMDTGMMKEYWEHRQVAEYLEELKQYRDLEEQGLLLRLPISVSELVDKLFSHNETIALWEKRKDEISYHYLLWKGMAWDIPKEYAKCKFVKMFGAISEKIENADVINIEITQSEAEEKLRELEGKYNEK